MSGNHLMMIKCHFSSEENYNGNKGRAKNERGQIMIVMSEQIPFKLIIFSKDESEAGRRRVNSFRIYAFDVRIIAEDEALKCTLIFNIDTFVDRNPHH